MYTEKPVLRNTFVFITGKEFFQNEEERVAYEKSIIDNFFWCENPKKFNIVIAHKPEEWIHEKISTIKGQFVVLFTKGVTEELIVFFKKTFFQDKNCVVFCQDDHKLQSEKIINFTKHSGYFVTTEKLSKTYEAYFHEEVMPDKIRKLYAAPC